MDLGLYSRVLRRFRVLVAIGIVLAIMLAFYSYYKISFENGRPHLTNRKSEVWQAQSTIFLASEQPARTYTDPGRFIGLAPLYAQFGNGDPVRNATARQCGRLPGTYSAIPLADTSNNVVNGLPMVSILGAGATPDVAAKMSVCATNAFIAYMEKQQLSSGVPASRRVQMTVIRTAGPGEASIVVPRKKTLPIVILLAVLFATIALAFVLENARPRVRVIASDDATDIRRTA